MHSHTKTTLHSWQVLFTFQNLSKGFERSNYARVKVSPNHLKYFKVVRDEKFDPKIFTNNCFSTYEHETCSHKNQDKVARNASWFLSDFLVFEVFLGTLVPSPVGGTVGDHPLWMLKTPWNFLKTIKYFWRICPGFVGTGLICIFITFKFWWKCFFFSSSG